MHHIRTKYVSNILVTTYKKYNKTKTTYTIVQLKSFIYS